MTALDLDLGLASDHAQCQVIYCLCDPSITISLVRSLESQITPRSWTARRHAGE